MGRALEDLCFAVALAAGSLLFWRWLSLPSEREREASTQSDDAGDE